MRGSNIFLFCLASFCFKICTYFSTFWNSKNGRGLPSQNQRLIQDRRTGCALPVWIFFWGGVVFVNFHCRKRIWLYFITCISQHAICTICILFSTLSTKTKGKCELQASWRVFKTILRPKEFHRAGAAPTVLKFIDLSNDNGNKRWRNLMNIRTN